MEYSLVNAKENNITYLVDAKLQTIFTYAKNLDDEEKNNIIEFTNNNVRQNYSKHKLIVNEKENIVYGCLYVCDRDDGVSLDEIFINEEYRYKGLGKHIIKNLMNEHNIIYLCVYKDNRIAYNLYYKLGFEIIDQTESRYYMQYKKYK